MGNLFGVIEDKKRFRHILEHSFQWCELAEGRFLSRLDIFLETERPEPFTPQDDFPTDFPFVGVSKMWNGMILPNRKTQNKSPNILCFFQELI